METLPHGDDSTVPCPAGPRAGRVPGPRLAISVPCWLPDLPLVRARLAMLPSVRVTWGGGVAAARRRWESRNTARPWAWCARERLGVFCLSHRLARGSGRGVRQLCCTGAQLLRRPHTRQSCRSLSHAPGTFQTHTPRARPAHGWLSLARRASAQPFPGNLPLQSPASAATPPTPWQLQTTRPLASWGPLPCPHPCLTKTCRE